MKLTLSVSIDEDLDAAIRAEAERQRRPLSWVVEEALRAGLPHRASASLASNETPAATTPVGGAEVLP